MSPEEEVVLHALRRLTRGTALPSLPGVDGAQLTALAQAHHLAPVLDFCLPAGAAPAGAAAELKSIARQRRVRTLVMTQAFHTLAAGFQRAGIPCLPLKGIALAHTVYPSPTLRYFDDLDVLIPPDAAPAALEVLRRLGYTPHPRALRPDWHHLIPYAHPQHGTTVELHTGLVRYHPPAWSAAQVWERAQLGQLAEQPVWLLAPEDALALAALHARHHLFSRLTFVVDVALLAQRLPDRRLAWQRSREAGAASALAHLLEVAAAWGLAEDWSDAPTSPLARYTARRLAAGDGLRLTPAGLHHGVLPKLLELLLLDTWRERGRLGRALLWPQAAFVAAGYEQEEGQRGGYGRRLWQRGWLVIQEMAALLGRRAE